MHNAADIARGSPQWQLLRTAMGWVNTYGRDLSHCLEAELKREPRLALWQNEHGTTLLHTALRNGKIRAVRMLLHSGADPNHADKQNAQTPLNCVLNFAGRFDSTHCEMLKDLLAAGADPNKPVNSAQYRPLSLALMCKHTEAIAILLEAGANISLCESEGHTLAQAATIMRFPQAADLIARHSERQRSERACTAAVAPPAPPHLLPLRSAALAPLPRQLAYAPVTDVTQATPSEPVTSHY